MNKLFILLLMMPVAALAQDERNRRSLSQFENIEVYDGIILTLERGDSNILFSAAGTELDKLEVSLTGNTLRIRKLPGTKYDKDPQLRLVYKNIKSISGYGKADLDTRNLILTDSLSIILKSGARFYGSFDVDFLKADITEGCLFTAKGYADIQLLEVNLKASISAFELEGKTGEVRAAGGGKAKINISDKLNAEAVSGGYIGYKGSPKLQEKKSLGGKIVKDSD